MSEAPAIRCEIVDRVATITIDRTDRRNAINLAALNSLDAAFDEAIDAEVAAIVIRGEGGHFCSGADLKELEDHHFDLRLREVLEHLVSVPVPTIAAISGACMGLGMQLALACDLRFATDDSYFGIPAGKLGLVVNHWTLQRLQWFLGAGAARLMVLTADRLSFEQVNAAGFLQGEGGLDVVAEVTDRIKTLAPLAIAGAKLGLNLVERDLDEPAFNEAFRAAWASEDLAEGQLAFKERRTPVFRGR